MTCRQRHRQQLLRTIELWMRRHGVYFVFALLFSFALSGTALAVELKSTEQASPLLKPLKAIQAKVQATKEPAKKAETKKAKGALPDLDEADDKAEGVLKTVSGTVSGSSRYGIAVEHGVDAKGTSLEMWADYLSSTTLSGAKKFSELQYGDTVELTYKELKDGSKRLLKKVKLIRKAPKETPVKVSGAGL